MQLSGTREKNQREKHPPRTRLPRHPTHITFYFSYCNFSLYLTLCRRAHKTSRWKINFVSSAAMALHWSSDLEFWVLWKPYSDKIWNVFRQPYGLDIKRHPRGRWNWTSDEPHICAEWVVISYSICMKGNIRTRGRGYKRMNRSSKDVTGENSDIVDEEIKMGTEDRSSIANELRRQNMPLKTFFPVRTYTISLQLRYKSRHPTHFYAPLFSKSVERKLIEALKVGYDVAEEGVTIPLFSLVREFNVYFIHWGKMVS